jgi:type II secretory pathway component PulM
MSSRLVDILIRLAPRERVLLGFLVLVIVPIGIVFGVLVPLNGARETALSQSAQAIALNIWVQDRVSEANTLVQSPNSVPRRAVGTSEIEQDLISLGLRDAVSELSSDSDGVVALRFDDVRFTRLANWMSALDPASGYIISDFRIEATETSGNVVATLTLVPQAD